MKLRVVGAALICAALLPSLSACQPDDHQLDVALRQIDYRTAGHVTGERRANHIGDQSRTVMYDSSSTYGVLLKRLQRQGYSCDKGAASTDYAHCGFSGPVYVTLTSSSASNTTELHLNL